MPWALVCSLTQATKRITPHRGHRSPSAYILVSCRTSLARQGFCNVFDGHLCAASPCVLEWAGRATIGRRSPFGVLSWLIGCFLAERVKFPTTPISSTVPPTRLSEELAALSASAANESLTFADIFARLQGRVYPLVLVLISLPFCQPLALPGLSTPFGVVIALLGLRFALRQKPWLPAKLMVKRLPPKLLPAILRGGAVVLRWIEKLLHPRMTWIFDWRMLQFTAGIMISVSGLLLLLPLPVPLSNFFPALAVVMIASAIAERDGFMLIAGGIIFTIACAFIALIFIGGIEMFEWLKDFLFSYFSGD